MIFRIASGWFLGSMLIFRGVVYQFIYLFIVPWQVVTDRYHEIFRTQDIPISLKKNISLATRSNQLPRAASKATLPETNIFAPENGWLED